MTSGAPGRGPPGSVPFRMVSPVSVAKPRRAGAPGTMLKGVDDTEVTPVTVETNEKSRV